MAGCKADLKKIKSMNESEYFQTSRPGLEDMNRQMNGWNIWAKPVYIRAKALAKVLNENNLWYNVKPAWRKLKPGWNDQIEKLIAKQEKELENCVLSLMEQINYDDATAGAIAKALGPLMESSENRYFWLPEEGGFWRDWLLQLTEQQKQWVTRTGIKNKPLEDLISKAVSAENLRSGRHQFQIMMKGVDNLTDLFFDVARLFYDPVGLVSEKVSGELKKHGVSDKVANKAGKEATEKLKLKNPDPQTTPLSPADIEKAANWAADKFEGSYLEKFDRQIRKLDSEYKAAQQAYAQSQTLSTEQIPVIVTKKPEQPVWPLLLGLGSAAVLLGVIFWPAKRK